MIELAGFLPDADPNIPGIITSASNIVPTARKSYIGGPSQVDAVSGLGAVAAQVRGAAVLVNTGGTRRTLAGTQTRIYELSGTAWVDVSRGSAYAGSTESRWIFEQFGNVALAANDVEKIQWSTGSGFADVTAGPVAKIIFATDNFVMALNTNHTAVGDNPDGWMCSAYQDYSSWTASVTTQATNGRLIGNGGALTAGLALGGYAVAYKERSIFLGSYVGSPVVWQWDRVPGDVGCIGPEAVCDIGGAHVFAGPDNIWLFDGTRPTPIASGKVKDYLNRNISGTLRYRTALMHDQRRNLVWVFYVSANGTGLDSALVYNTVTGQWGVADQSIEAILRFVSPGVTWDTMSSVAATWDTLPNTPWDSPFWQVGSEGIAVFNTSHQLKTLSGESTGGSLTTGDYGSDSDVSMLRSSRLRFLTSPTSATSQPLCKMTSGGSLVAQGTSSLADGKFDHRSSGRFHRVGYTMTGPFEVNGVEVEIVRKGQR